MYKFQDKTVDVICTLKTNSSDLHVDIDAWLAGSPSGSYHAWKQRMPSKCKLISVVFLFFTSCAFDGDKNYYAQELA